MRSTERENKCKGCKWSNTLGGWCDECSRAFKDRYESDHKKKTDDDTISRRMAVDALRDEFKRTPTTAIRAMDVIGRLPSAQPEPEELDFVQPHKKIGVELKIGQPEIIRCQDCRWRKDQSGSTAWLPCRTIVTPSDFSCCHAERRTDECTD